MEDGGVDTTVIKSRQHKMGQMADFPSLLASSVFDSWCTSNWISDHGLMNLVNTTLFYKYVDPGLKMSIYGSVLNSCFYISLGLMFWIHPATYIYVQKDSKQIKFSSTSKPSRLKKVALYKILWTITQFYSITILNKLSLLCKMRSWGFTRNGSQKSNRWLTIDYLSSTWSCVCVNQCLC